MEILLTYKWVTLLVLEILAWSATFFMMYARYGMKSHYWFRIGAVVFTITGVIPQVLIGVINFWFTKRFDLFTVILVLLILYGGTIGKKHVKKLDKWVEGKFSNKDIVGKN
jgi:hypothetical protein